LKEFLITKEVKDFLKEQDCDFRVCTFCGGPVMLPITARKPKPSDIKIQVDDHILYVSVTQARYIDVIDSSMLATHPN
jgi:NAD(P)H-flavin reductase